MLKKILIAFSSGVLHLIFFLSVHNAINPLAGSTRTETLVVGKAESLPTIPRFPAFDQARFPDEWAKIQGMTIPLRVIFD